MEYWEVSRVERCLYAASGLPTVDGGRPDPGWEKAESWQAPKLSNALLCTGSAAKCGFITKKKKHKPKSLWILSEHPRLHPAVGQLSPLALRFLHCTTSCTPTQTTRWVMPQISCLGHSFNGLWKTRQMQGNEIQWFCQKQQNAAHREDNLPLWTRVCRGTLADGGWMDREGGGLSVMVV